MAGGVHNQERTEVTNAELVDDQLEQEIPVDELLPESMRFSPKLISSIEKYNNNCAQPWISISAQVIPLRYNLRGKGPTRYLQGLPSDQQYYVVARTEHARLLAEAETVQSGIFANTSRHMVNRMEKISKRGRLKRFLIPGYASKRDQEARAWLEDQEKQASTLKQLAIRGLQDVASDRISNIQRRIDQASIEYINKVMAADPKLQEKDLAETLPGALASTSNDLLQAIKQVEELGVFLKECYTEIGYSEWQSLDRQRRALEKSIAANRHGLMTAIEGQITEIIDTGLSRAGILHKLLDYSESGYVVGGMLGKFTLVPTAEQAEIVEQLTQNIRDLLKAYGSEYLSGKRQSRNYQTEHDVQSLAERAKYRRSEYLRILNEMGRWILAVKTPDVNATEIITEGYLRSSREILQATGRNPSHSQAGAELGGLRYISFGINGIDDIYGVPKQLRSGGRTPPYSKLANMGVTFIYTLADATRDNPFFVVGKSRMNTHAQQSGFDHEVHLYPQNFDPRSEKRQEVALSIDNAIVLIPEANKDVFLALLQKPKEEGGAGRDDEWINSHVIFYPPSEHPNRHIQKRVARVLTQQDDSMYLQPYYDSSGRVVGAPIREQVGNEPLFLYRHRKRAV